jgi:hypothetical protein
VFGIPPMSGRLCSSHPFTGLGTRAAGLNTSFHLIVFRNPFTRVGGVPRSGLKPRDLALKRLSSLSPTLPNIKETRL